MRNILLCGPRVFRIAGTSVVRYDLPRPHRKWVTSVDRLRICKPKRTESVRNLALCRWVEHVVTVTKTNL